MIVNHTYIRKGEIDMSVVSSLIEKILNNIKEKEQEITTTDPIVLRFEREKERCVKWLTELETQLEILRNVKSVDLSQMKPVQRTFIERLKNDPELLETQKRDKKAEIARVKRLIDLCDIEKEYAREPFEEDVQERKNIFPTHFDKILKALNSLESTSASKIGLYGASFVHSAEIVETGAIEHRYDRSGRISNRTEVGKIPIRECTKSGLELCLKQDMDIERSSDYLPCGCLFVVKPKDSKDEWLMNEHLLSNIYLTDSPEQLVCIVTTSESKEKLLQIASEYCIDKSKIIEFEEVEGFLAKQLQEEKENIYQNEFDEIAK